ncbi:MAG TPA: DNA-processing protein DprA [Solirubrobacteraceae bacterium]|nr:DNA-processing protein DprA [Solirubrobacteraceae bacterium]
MTELDLQPLPCEPCLRRTRLIASLAGHLERARHGSATLCELLALTDAELLAIPRPLRSEQLRSQIDSVSPAVARADIGRAGLVGICRHDPRYPRQLRDRRDAPAILHAAGAPEVLPALLGAPAVSIVGARRASDYGLEVAESIGRGLAAAGVVVVSGLAAGIDSAAHRGALAAGGLTVAVLAGGADVAYPARAAALYRRIRSAGAVVSEMPPGFRAFRWGFVARNRVIAALGQVTVVVEGAQYSGSLVTAAIARERGATVAAVPGRVTSPLAHGPHELVRQGAVLVRDARDVLDLMAGVRAAPPVPGPPVEPHLQALLDAVAAGRDTAAALASCGLDPGALMAGLSELELVGRLRRGAEGRYTVLA